MRTFCRLTREEDRSSVIIVRWTISRAHESLGNFFARFFSRTSKETSLWDGGGSWDSSKKKRKKGATSVTGGGQGGTQGEYAFFSIPSVSYTRRSERLRSRFASILDSKFFPVAFPFPMLVSSQQPYHVGDSISDGRGEQSERKKNRSVALGKFSNRNDSRRACFFSWKFMLYYHRRHMFETYAPRGRSDPTVTKGYF